MDNAQPTAIPYGYCHCGCGLPAPISPVNRRALGYVKGEPRRFRVGHRAKLQPNAEQRFWANVDKGGPVPKARPALGPCWTWLGTLDGDGYARMSNERKDARAHRFAYELLVGLIPEGLTLDHLCRNKRCVNPSHLEPVTFSENSRRARVDQMREGGDARTRWKLARWRVIADLRNAGATRAELAVALGTTPVAIDSTMTDMRSAGWKLLTRRETERLRRLHGR